MWPLHASPAQQGGGRAPAPRVPREHHPRLLPPRAAQAIEVNLDGSGKKKKSSLGMDVTWQGSAKPAAAGIKTLLAHEEAVWLLYSRLGPHFGLLQLCREVRCGRRAARLGGSRMQRRGVAACAGGAVPRSHFCSGTEENPRLCFAAHLAVAPASSQPHALKQGLSSVRLQL